MSVYNDFKARVLGKHIGDGQCVALVVNTPASYTAAIWPNESWPHVIGPVVGAKDMFNSANPAYFEKIANNVNDPNQLPKQGDILVFSQTPYAGYTNTFNNPYGHTGICDKADSTGYWLLQQNSPAAGQAANVTFYPWKFRHCIGWLRPRANVVSAPAPHLQLEVNPGNWAVYTGAGKASTRLPGYAQGGQKYGPVLIMTNGWAQLTYLGKIGYIEPAAFHLF